MKKYGACDWYNWSCQNWGTKWDVDHNGNVDFEQQSPTTARFVFDTAWSPPVPVMEALSELFPKLEIHLRYNEEGNDVHGCEYWGPNSEDHQCKHHCSCGCGEG